MTVVEYVIVGAEVDEARRFVLPNGEISASNVPGARPLTVEFIGERMVELSKSGPKVTPAEKNKFINEVKNALRVKVPGDAGGPQLSDAEEQAILDGTTVSVNFETRLEVDGQTDRNTRVLTVPSRKTLEVEAESLPATSELGFRPPLTYALDEALMLARLFETVLGIFDRFGDAAIPGWGDNLRGKLRAHVDEEIRNFTPFVEGAGDPADSVLNEIMQSPLRAFHRSVGIYATNMCR